MEIQYSYSPTVKRLICLNLKINIDRKLYWIIHFYLDLCCASSEWYSNNHFLGCVFWSPIWTFKMCIASPILVTGSVNGSQNVYCVSDYCQRLWHMYSSIRSESRYLFFFFILKTTGTFTPVHSAVYLILRNELRSTQKVARQNIQVKKKGNKLTFLNHLLAPTFLAQNPKNKK
jgi:hypothetical protein